MIKTRSMKRTRQEFKNLQAQKNKNIIEYYYQYIIYNNDDNK